MSEGKRIGGITVTLMASSDKFNKTMSGARRHLTLFDKATKNTTLGLKSFGAAMAGGLTLGAMMKFTHEGIEQIATLSDLSTKLGISTEKLAGFQMAAEDSGVSNALFEKSILRMTKGINDAALGVGSASKAYERLGINVQDLKNLAPDEQFLSIMDSVNSLTGQNEKLNATMTIFGTKGSDMVRLLGEGRSGMAKFQEQAQRMGLSIKDEMAAEVEAASDKLAVFQRTLNSFKMRAAIAVTPAITAADEAMRGMQDNPGDMWKYFGGSLFDEIMGGAFGPTQVRSIHANKPGISTGLFPNLFSGTNSGAALPVTPRSVFQAQEKSKAQADLTEWMDDLVGKAIGGLKSLPGKRMGGIRLGDAAEMAGSWRWMLGAKAAGAMGGLEGLERMKGVRTSAQQLQRPALSFAESGSVESFRQQAAIRKQSEEIGKKQLTTQQKMEGHLAKIAANQVTFRPANIA